MKKQSSLNQLIVLAAWVALVIFGALGITPLIPPAPPTTLDTVDFNVTLAFDHIEQIAQEPRPIGSLANQRVRAYIVAQLKLLGLDPEVQTSEAIAYYGGSTESVEIGNVVARIHGTAPTSAVALVGHYDTVPGTPGANDDASAVAIILESARAILAGQRLRNDVILIFIDAEEPAPRYGSSAFIAEHPWASDIGFVINLEAIGTGGPSTLIGISGSSGLIIDRYIEAVPYPAVFSFLTTTADLIGGSNSDFATFRDAGVAGVEFAYLRGSPIYHTLSDTPDRVSQRSLEQQGANTLSLTRHISNLGFDLSLESADAVFFSVGRSRVVRYPTTWAFPLAMVTGAVLIAVGWRQRTWFRIFRSAACIFATMTGSAIAAVGVWAVLAGQRGTMGIAESYLYLAGLIVLTTGIGTVVTRVAERRIGEEPNAIGVMIVLWVLGFLTAILAPGMSYIFIWPALAGGMVLLYRSSSKADHRWQLILSVPVVGTTLVLLIPAVDTFFALVQPRPGNTDSEMLSIIAIPIVLIALVVEVFREFWLQPLKCLVHQGQMPIKKE